MTVRQKQLYRKMLHVIQEYGFDCDSDIEGCDGDQLLEIEHCLRAAWSIADRLQNYLTGKIDNPRGIKNGETPMTLLPK